MALEPITRKEKIIAGQDLTPVTRMEKFLKQFGGGGGSGLPTGGAAYQQLVTDGEGNAKWEDKAFGTMNGFVVETKEFDITGSGKLIGEFAINAGKTYTVIFDGVEYNCVCVLYNGAYPAIGSLDGTFSDYPFLIAYNGGLFCIAQQAGTHTIGILGEYIKRLSFTYLPETISKSKTIYFDATDDELNEAYEHFEAGGLLYLAEKTVLGVSGSLDVSGLVFVTADGTYTFTGGGEFKTTTTLTNFPDSGEVAPSNFYLHSSTSGSNKQFKITVDDTGALKATEVT